MTKHTCTQCHRNLFPVHPIEVKRAIQLLVALSKNPKKLMGELQSLSNLCEGDSGSFGSISSHARTEAAYRLEPDHKKWSNKWTSQEYNLAAQILSDGWLPAGYILDKEKELWCSHTQTEEYIPDPNGNVTVCKTGEPSVKCRRVVTLIPESERVHDGYYCPLSKDPF